MTRVEAHNGEILYVQENTNFTSVIVDASKSVAFLGSKDGLLTKGRVGFVHLPCVHESSLQSYSSTKSILNRIIHTCLNCNHNLAIKIYFYPSGYLLSENF